MGIKTRTDLIADGVVAHAMAIEQAMGRYPLLRQGHPSRAELVASVNVIMERLVADWQVLLRAQAEEAAALSGRE